MLEPINALVLTILAQGAPEMSAEGATAPAGGDAALSIDWSSWGAVIESLSGPVGVRLGLWLGLGCAVGLFMCFAARSLKGLHAIMGGIVAGLLAAGAFVVALPRLDEMICHLLAGGVLGLFAALMVLKDRAGDRLKEDAFGAGFDGENTRGALDYSPASPATAPAAAPKPAKSAKPPAPAVDVEDEEEEPAPAPDPHDEAEAEIEEPQEPAPAPVAESAPEPPEPAPKAPPEASTSAPNAQKKSSAATPPQKTGASKAASGTPAWMQGGD